MNLFSSAFLGVNVGKKTATNYSDLKTLDKEQEISAMCWATEEEQMVRIILKLSKIFFLKLLQACWMLRFWKGKVTRHFFAGHPLKFVNLYWNISTKAIAFGASVKYHAWLHINRWLNTSNNKHYYNICCNFCIIPSLKFMSTFSGLELLFHGAQEDGHGLSPQLFAFKTFPQTFKIKKPEIPGLL